MIAINLEPIKIKYEINSKAAPELAHVEHVNNKSVTELEISFYENGNILKLDESCRVSAAVVCDKIMINDSLECTVNQDGAVRVPIDNKSLVNRAGNMKIELTIKDGDKLFTPPFPIWVKVERSVLDNAEVTEKSMGIMPDFLEWLLKTKDDTDKIIDGKADKADSLAGYGIKNAYNKDETDDMLALKADKEDFERITNALCWNEKTFTDVFIIDRLKESLLVENELGLKSDYSNKRVPLLPRYSKVRITLTQQPDDPNVRNIFEEINENGSAGGFNVPSLYINPGFGYELKGSSPESRQQKTWEWEGIIKENVYSFGISSYAYFKGRVEMTVEVIGTYIPGEQLTGDVCASEVADGCITLPKLSAEIAAELDKISALEAAIDALNNKLDAALNGE